MCEESKRNLFRLLTSNSPKVVAKLSRKEKRYLWLNIVVSFLRKSIGNICRRQQFQRPAQPSIQWNDRAAEMKFQIQTLLFPHIIKGTTDPRVECFCQSKVRTNDANLSPFRQIEKMLFKRCFQAVSCHQRCPWHNFQHQQLLRSHPYQWMSHKARQWSLIRPWLN